MREHGVLDDIGEVAGMKGVAVVHGVMGCHLAALRATAQFHGHAGLSNPVRPCLR